MSIIDKFGEKVQVTNHDDGTFEITQTLIKIRITAQLTICRQDESGNVISYFYS